MLPVGLSEIPKIDRKLRKAGTSIDGTLNLGMVGCANDCYIGIYNEAIKNKYFLQCRVGVLLISQFKLHSELQEQWKADEHSLAESIQIL